MQKWTEAMKTFASAVRVAGVAAGMARPAKAGGLGADTIGLFPKGVGEFAYADLQKARTMKWYPALEQQMLPEKFRQFEKFLAAAGIDTNTQVERVDMGTGAGVGVEQGCGGQWRGGNGCAAGQRRDRGDCTGKLQPGFDGSVFQGAEASDFEVAWLHAVCVRVGRRAE